MKNIILTFTVLMSLAISEAATIPFVFTRNPTTNKLCIVQASGGTVYSSATGEIVFNGVVTTTEVDYDISEDGNPGQALNCSSTSARIAGRLETFATKECGPGYKNVTTGGTYCAKTSGFLCKATYVDGGGYLDPNCPMAFSNVLPGDEVVLFFLDWGYVTSLNTP
jgi:hypothetical protein